MSDYEDYEAQCEKIRAKNEVLLTEFGQWLESSGLSIKTINNHVYNVDFYIN